MSLLQSTPPQAASAPADKNSATGVIDAKRERDAAIIADAKANGDARNAEADAVQHAEDSRKAGMSWDQALAEAPAHIQTLMKNMRADYTRKTQEVAQERKTLAAEREALLKSGTLEKLKAKADADLGEFNVFDEGSIQARIEQEVARRLHEALAPIEQEHKQAQAKQEYHSFLDKNPDLKADPEVRKEVYEALAPIEQEHKQAQAKQEYHSFLHKNPDLKSDPDVRKEVYEALKKNPGLDLESAYYAVKGKRATSIEAQREARKHAEREAARAAALTATGSGKRVGTPTLNSDALPERKPGERLDAWAVYQELKRQAR